MNYKYFQLQKKCEIAGNIWIQSKMQQFQNTLFMTSKKQKIPCMTKKMMVIQKPKESTGPVSEANKEQLILRTYDWSSFTDSQLSARLQFTHANITEQRKRHT
jgi:hypothetical protein